MRIAWRITTLIGACALSSSCAQHREVLRGYPTPADARDAYDELDANRALSAYRAFYPTVSGAAMFKGNAKVGVVLNQRFGYLDTKPRHVGFTLNSDTPYGGILLDLSRTGPLVIEVPPGPLLGATIDIHQRWVADMGIPGPDAGKGGKHLLLPPGHQGDVPEGYHVGRATSFKVLAGVRSLPENGDVAGAIERLQTIRVHPLHPDASWTEPEWFDMTPQPQDTTPVAWEDDLQFWRELNEVVQSEPPVPEYREHYGDLAALGIEKGRPFEPDARMQSILADAAERACALMRVESFADRRPDRVVWSDRRWEWAGLRPENGVFDVPNYTDTYAREKWFFQAIAASPAMFRRDPKAGSLYWLGTRDASGAYLDGAKTYKLAVPQPVPARLFWSVTIYDTETRSQIATDQSRAALRTLFELKDVPKTGVTELYFGPEAPAGREGRWIKTIPGKGWFTYFRIYGPESPAFDGGWKPGDFELVK